jgi:hypothetical protein
MRSGRPAEHSLLFVCCVVCVCGSDPAIPPLLPIVRPPVAAALLTSACAALARPITILVVG